jgi:hypothetical protein
METAVLCCAVLYLALFLGLVIFCCGVGAVYVWGIETAIMKRLEMNDILPCIDVMCCLVAPLFLFSSSFFVLCLGDGGGYGYSSL